MNRNIYRLVFNTASGMLVPVAETARSRGRAASGTALVLAGLLLAGVASAEMPVACPAGACGGTAPASITGFVTSGSANYQVNGTQGIVSQVGDKSILNWRSFNVSPGHDVRFQQVGSLTSQNLVQGASFTSLNRIWDMNPSVIAGSISQAAGQKANIILVNTNGIAFMGGSQVNLNSFTASSLNIDDSFILGSFLPKSGSIPQFEGTGGFIKVFEGARITAGSQGRVMLIAPTVVNKGTVEAPDGQVVLAAGTKVFLRAASVDDNVRGLLVEVDSLDSLNSFDADNTGVKDGVLDGQAVALKDAALDKLGHATNLGELTTPRGNVTMIGYAVNQQGIARATTSVVANGSVYLLAKDRSASSYSDASQRGGRVVLGKGSLTEVLPDVADTTGALDGETGTGLPRSSQIQVLGLDVRMEGGATILAPSGEVNLIAMDEPGKLDALNGDPFKTAGASYTFDKARIHIADGAIINVAGLENVEISAARNSVEVELRGDELKDSPVNRDGALRGEKAFVDINLALANANAGKSTLIAQDSLESYQARTERTVAERSTAGGTVKVRSQGEAILETGAVIDLSGGSLLYTPATVKTTLLTSNGKLTDLAEANAETKYDGIATRYVVDYGKWNVKEVIDLGQSYRYDPGYVEGKNAGALEVMGMGAVVLQADIQGRTTVGGLQRDTGTQPAGARLMLGTGSVPGDYKLNQQIEVSSTAATLPSSFGFGDVLPAGLKNTLALNPALFGKDKVANLEAFSNQAATVREALRMPQGGSVQITANGVAVNADIEAAGGAITLNARSIDSSVMADVVVVDGVTLSARGAWVNELPGAAAGMDDVALLNGGKITLSATGDVELGQGSLVDVTSGGRIKADGKFIAGNGGKVGLKFIFKEKDGVPDAESVADESGVLKLGGEVLAYGFGKGDMPVLDKDGKPILDKNGKPVIGQGSVLAVSTSKIKIGGTPDSNPGTLNLDAGFFERGGFADFNLSGREGVTLADEVEIRPTVMNLELQPGYTLHPTGSKVENFTRKVKLDDRVRQAANLSLTALGTFLGDVVIGSGASIQADPKAKVAFTAAHLIDINGHVTAPGGSITAKLDRGTSLAFDPTNTLWLGSQAALDTSGVARTYTDSKGLVKGEALAGGSVTLNAQTGYVVSEVGSTINISGAAPVRLDIPNESGGLGMMVGSDAGSLTIYAREGVLLDGAIKAQAGGISNRGGTFSLNLIGDRVTDYASPEFDRVVSLAQTVTPQANGLTPGAAIPDALNGQAKLGAEALEAAGFDRITLKSRDAIRLENGLNMGANRTLPLKEVQLDSPRIETAGGDAAIKAETLRLGNYDADRQVAANPQEEEANIPKSGTGTFRADAQLLELAGNQTLTGMARAELNGAQEVRLVGVNRNPDKELLPIGALMGKLNTAADLVFHGAVVSPATYSQFEIKAAGHMVEFSRNTATPSQPLSALGSLTVIAENIVQGGNVWAPFGQLDFQAANTITFKDGSLTSVAATPGSLTPFGNVVNGSSWTYTADSIENDQAKLPEKSIRTSGADIDMQAGAQVNLAGGGDLQAYEFTVGPGGSRNILSDVGTYAILPGYASGFAPGDAQEIAGFDRKVGDAVYLSGMPGLSAGTYTLLPAHYALLPGAYAVKLNNGVKDLVPGQAYSKQDGVQVVPGYVTDNRTSAPRDSRWSGFEVLSRDQVLQRSELTLTRASEFFADGRNRPQDAGLLSIATTGSVKLDAIYNLAAANGGHGAGVDISASNLAITSGNPSGIDPAATRVDVDKLNALGAESLLLGGTRSASGDTTTLTVGADTVTLANDAAHALKGSEIILAAKDTLTLKNGSAIDAQGDAGDAGNYTAAGNGALVRAASSTASFARDGSQDGASGTLTGEAGSTIKASSSIALDATKKTDFQGATIFADAKGNSVAGNLAMGATRVSFGAAPTGSEGLVFSQTELDGLNSLNSLASLALTSYNTFDLYGDVSVGGIDAQGKPTMQNLTLRGAGLAGLGNSGKTANLRATELLIDNPANATYVAGGALGDGTLVIQADKLVLGQGNKKIQGYSTVNVTANELIGRGTGETTIAAETNLNVARISGEQGSNQALDASGELNVAKTTADRVLAAVNALGAKWALSGTKVSFDTQATLPSGQLKLTATTGKLELGENAEVDVAGRTVDFFDVSRPAAAGKAELVSDNGDVVLQAGAVVNVSAAAGGDAGDVIIRAVNGKAIVAGNTLQGSSPVDAAGERGEGARFELDVNNLADFSALNTTLNQGEFDGARSVRVRTGDLNVAASDTVSAHDIKLSADSGKLTVRGEINADGDEGGSIQLYSGDRLTLESGAKLSARALQDKRAGGTVTLGSTSEDAVLAGGSISTAGLAGGQDGTVLIRAGRFDDVAFTNLYAPLPDTGTANNYTVSLNGATLLRGLVVAFNPKFNNTASSKLNLSGTGAKDVWYNGAPVTASRIKANETVYMAYDGTRFHIVDAAFANRTATPVLGTSSTTGTTTNYVASQSGVTSYKAGMTLVYTPDADNIGTTNKLNINNLGVKDIKYNNVTLAAGSLKAGEPVYLVYDGTAFQAALEVNAPRATGSASALALASTRAVSAGNSYAFVAKDNSVKTVLVETIVDMLIDDVIVPTIVQTPVKAVTTLTVNGVTGALMKNGVNLSDLNAGEVKTNDLVYVSYDGSAFHLLSELAAKVDVGKGVRVTSVAGDYTKAIGTSITGASSIAVEAVRSYDALAINGAGVLDGNRLSADTYRYLPKAGQDDVKATLAGAAPAFDVTKFHLRPGTEIRSEGDIVLPRDLNLADYRYGGEPGVLTVRAEGNLLIKNNLSDGFSHVTPCTTATCDASKPLPATLLSGDSWSYRLVAGADNDAADPLAVKKGNYDVTLAAGKMVRTGTGDIHIASGGNIKLADSKSAIYTAGRVADMVSDFVTPANAQFSQGGGNVSLAALGNITGSPSLQLYSNWLFRQGSLNADDTAYMLQPAWWVRFDQFQQGVGALGGGDISIKAGGKVEDISASTPTQARMTALDNLVATGELVKTGGGDVRVESGGDLLGGQYYADNGDLVLKVGGKIDSGQKVGTGGGAKLLYTILALGDAQARVQAQGDVIIETVINPHLVVQSSSTTSGATSANVVSATDAKWSLFSTYGEDSGVNLSSLDGKVTLHNGSSQVQSAYKTPLSLWSNINYGGNNLLSVLPPSLSATAFQGDILVDGTQAILSPAARSNLTLLAANSVNIHSKVTMSDMDPALFPNVLRPGTKWDDFNPAIGATKHAAVPVHTGDTQPVRVYAVTGDIEGEVNELNLDLPKAVWVRAGQDVRDLGILAQHVNAGDVSRIEAGRDVVFDSGSERSDTAKVWIGGPGRLEVTAGRDINLGTSAGIVSRGDLDNAALPKGGVDIHVAAGVGPNGIDFAGAVDRLIASIEASGGNPDDATLWQARWLTGDDALGGSNALAAVKAVDALDAEGQRGRVREMIYSALRTTGRDSNNPDSPYAADYARGYAALELAFPGISEKNPDGRFKNYQGEVNLFASRIKSERGGDIEFMVPGGGLIVGLSNTPKTLVSVYMGGDDIEKNTQLKTDPLGMTVVEKGDIRGFARDDILVNQSRILTVGGGDILLWSSEGDIDAGKGKKTATSVPAPISRTDPDTGSSTLELQGAVTGSGIGALSTGGIAAGDVDLVAPKGTVNAGDAGIRAGNLNIAAQIVLGADNISVSGSSTGTPVADTSAATATTSGATAAGGDQTTAALAQNLADATTKNSFRPTFITAEVVGHGE